MTLLIEGKLGFGSLFSNSFACVTAVNPRLLAGPALLLAVLAGEATAEKARPARPAGKSIEVEVARGGSVRIPLRGYERNLNRLQYKPIGSPRHGKLSRVDQPGASEGQAPGYVIYTHGNDENSVSDTFDFEVIATTGLRGRGRITIRVLDAPAQLLVTPTSLDFGTTAIGDTPVRRTVELANAGGGVIQGFLEIPEPFALADEGMFVLRRGEKAKIPVVFAPQRAGTYSFTVQPVPGDRAALTLKGEALQPFAVESSGSEFRKQPDQSRTAGAVVKNQSQSPQRISVVLPADSPVEQVPAFELSPGETTEVTLRIPAATKTRVAPFGVRFETADHAVLLEFQAPAIPPNLTIVSLPDFGTVKSGTAAKATLVLSNVGGAVADCRLQTPKNLTTEDGAPAFAVPPGTAHNITLKLVPKKDQNLPTNVVVAFRDRELSVPITAAWAPVEIEATREKPEAEPAASAPSASKLALNTDINIQIEKDATFIAYREQAGWTNFTLQHRPAGTAEWRNYQMPAPHEGLFAWITNLSRRIEKFFDTPIQRPEVADTEAEEKIVRIAIETKEVGGPAHWRLIAERSGQSELHPVSDEFRLTPERLVAAEPEAPVTQATPVPAPTQRQTIKSRAAGPVTEMASAGIRSERDSALVQVAFAKDLGVRRFRLERGAMVAPIDPKTQIPQAPEFEKMDPPEAEVELLGVAEGEAEGQKFTVCAARISGLEQGSRTYWRIIPEAKKGDLPPTSVILVDTLPRPPFPWNTLLLVALTLLLAGVLYLRWRMNRPPG
jgi:hypothetical protein